MRQFRIKTVVCGKTGLRRRQAAGHAMMARDGAWAQLRCEGLHRRHNQRVAGSLCSVMTEPGFGRP